MPVLRPCLLGLALAGGILPSAGCQYSGSYIQTREEVAVTYTAGPSTSVYQGTGTTGEYRFRRFEGRAEIAVEGGASWGLEGREDGSSRAVVQPLCGARVVLVPRADGRVTMEHAKGRKSVLRFVTGTWEDLAVDGEVVLRFEDDSWQAWIRATENAMLDILDDYRKAVFPRLDRNQDLSEARALDFLVDEKPLVRASRRELLVFFEAVRLQGGFEVTTRRKDPKYGWWSYELRPEVGEALVTVAEATAVVALVSLEVLARCACRCR